MKIIKYEVIPSPDGEKDTYVIWADCGDTKRHGFVLPPKFEKPTHAQVSIENLMFWFKLPVEAEKIMSHFNKEILK